MALPPIRAQWTLTQLAEFLGEAEATLGVASTASLRIVAYHADNGLVWPFGMALLVDVEDAPASEAVRAGSAWLVRRRSSLKSLADARALRQFFESWAAVTEPHAVARQVHEGINASHHPGRNPWHHLPCWSFDLGIPSPSPQWPSTPSVPSGPVIVPTRLFAASVGDAAAQYLGLPDLRGRSMPVDGAKVIVVDPRAYFSHVEATPRGARFCIGGLRVPAQLFLGVDRTAFDSSHANEHLPVVNSECEVNASPGQAIEVHLVGADSEPYDSYAEYATRFQDKDLLLVQRKAHVTTKRAKPLPLISNPSPSDAVVSDVLEQLTVESVFEAWTRALNRRDSEPDGAITAARTLLETVCKHILSACDVEIPPTADLSTLYGLTAKQLDLAPDKKSQAPVKQALSGCISVINGVERLRNLFGDAHGKAPDDPAPSSQHATLAVNLAGAMAMFLVQTWTEQRQK